MAAPLLLLPPGADLADAFAQDLIGRHRAQLPDLSAVTLVVPAAPAVLPLRRRLAHHAGRSLLGPRIVTLAGFSEAGAAGEPPLTALECKLLLIEALRRHRGVLPGVDRGRAAAALFDLFEELTANAVEPGADEGAFAERLRQAYGLAANPWMSREAQIVHRLWRGFSEDTAGRSPASTYRRRLAAAFASLRPAQPLHLVGLDRFDAAEAAIVAAALRDGRAELWLHGRLEGHDGASLRALCGALGVTPEPRPAPADARAELLDRAFSAEAAPPLAAGAALRIVQAASPEHEARCVDLAIRQALLNGAMQVAVLAEDRRLARRLRALLERGNITLEDRAGWALSTSSAAATLDSWLQCLETRFQFRPLLETLKSGFMEPPPAALLELERELIYGHPAIEGGLAALLAAARSSELRGVLRSLQAAAVSLPRGAITGARWMELLLGSLRKLPLWEALLADPAGGRLIGLLGELEAACARVPLTLTWPQLRELLDRAIEAETFMPQPGGGPVRLVNLGQAQLERPDVLIIAGATREQLPGGAATQPFFNASVRRELGLPSFPEHRALALSRLRRALQCAPSVLITYAPATLDEPAQLSPWLEAVEAQSTVSLRDDALPVLAASAVAEITDVDGVAPIRRRPAPGAPRALLPARLSSGAHQSLIECPYKFHAGAMLGLRGEQAPDEDPDRSDYGDRVHRILQAFVTAQAGFPPPFAEPVTAATRARAQARLLEIADAVFAADLEQRALAQTWQAEFRASVPRLLDWLEQRPELRAIKAEVTLERDLAGITLAGRADRIEIRADGTRAIIDYKTGKLPRRNDVESGEAVQLLHYALMDPGVTAVEYLALREDQAGFGFEAELPQLRDAAEQRLDRALRRIRAGAPLPAHGHEQVCQYCDFSGLCRREDWHD